METIGAIDRFIATGLERHLAGIAAGSAGCAEHFARAAAAAAAAKATLTFPLRATIRATTRGIRESFLFMELLLTSGEGKVPTAIAADEGFVSVAQGIHSFINIDRHGIAIW